MCLCNEANISQKTIQKFIVYGELMCNKIYDYKERDLVGKWKVFGVMISVKKEIIDDVFGKFIDIGFAVSKDSEKEKIWIYP